ncbi:MAG: hypothetical protein WD845_13820 [Pirellulales bacterium]
MTRSPFPLVVAAVMLAAANACQGDVIDEHLAVIAMVGRQAAGSAEAREACDALAEQDAAVLPRLLAAMQTSNPVAANWYRTAYEALVAREIGNPQPTFPVTELRAVLLDSKNSGRVRRLVLALCEQLEPGFTATFIPARLDDPEFRADAVDAALATAQTALENGDSETARGLLRQAFEHARTSDQVVRAAGKLTVLGEPADVVTHLGLVIDWWLIGPFDAPQFSGFKQVFPPEQGVDLQAEYAGQNGRTLRWTRHRTDDPLGLVNLVQALAPATEAVGYAYAELEAPRDMAAQLRCGADDNCAVWLNGQQVFAREQWLNGVRFDRFSAPVQLQKGKNLLLVKIGQGPQHKNPDVANDWSLYVRFCDEAGTGVGLRSLLPPISKEQR